MGRYSYFPNDIFRGAPAVADFVNLPIPKQNQNTEIYQFL